MLQRISTDIEPFAELIAQLDDPFADRGEVLRAAGLDEAALLRLRAHWSAILGAAPPDPGGIAQRFGQTYERSRLALAAARRNPHSGDAAPEPPGASASRDPALPTAPVTSAEPPAEEVDPRVPLAMRGFADLRSTELAPDAPPAGPVLPFDLSAPPKAPPISADPRVPPAMRGFGDLQETQLPLDVSLARPVLPFQRDLPPAEPPPGEAPSGVPSGMQAFTGIATMQPLSPEATEIAAARLSLEQYACLCTELSMYPAYRSEVLARYGISEQERQQVDAFWAKRIPLDENLRLAWKDFCTAHQARLIGSGRVRG